MKARITRTNHRPWIKSVIGSKNFYSCRLRSTWCYKFGAFYDWSICKILSFDWLIKCRKAFVVLLTAPVVMWLVGGYFLLKVF